VPGGAWRPFGASALNDVAGTAGGDPQSSFSRVRCIHNASCGRLGILRRLSGWKACAESIPESPETARDLTPKRGSVWNSALVVPAFFERISPFGAFSPGTCAGIAAKRFGDAPGTCAGAKRPHRRTLAKAHYEAGRSSHGGRQRGSGGNRTRPASRARAVEHSIRPLAMAASQPSWPNASRVKSATLSAR
jgi:hypothetical protein